MLIYIIYKQQCSSWFFCVDRSPFGFLSTHLSSYLCVNLWIVFTYVFASCLDLYVCTYIFIRSEQLCPVPSVLFRQTFLKLPRRLCVSTVGSDVTHEFLQQLAALELTHLIALQWGTHQYHWPHGRNHIVRGDDLCLHTTYEHTHSQKVHGRTTCTGKLYFSDVDH